MLAVLTAPSSLFVLFAVVRGCVMSVHNFSRRGILGIRKGPCLEICHGEFQASPTETYQLLLTHAHFAHVYRVISRFSQFRFT